MTTLERLECFYPSEVFGCIIGESGNRIKEIREKHQIKIFTEKSLKGSNFRSIRLEGQWVACWSAVMEITKCVAEDERAPAEARRNLEFHLRIPKFIAGAIIGKGGANLKEWRETHAPLDFHVDEEKDGDGNKNPNTDARILKIRGEPTKIADAAVVVADAVEDALQNNQNRDSQNRRRRDDNDDRGDNKRRRGDNHNSNQNGSAPFPQQGSFGGQQQGGFMGGQPFQQTGGQNSSFGGGGRPQGSFQANCNLLVDDGTCGRIIGAQGSTIKGFRELSGCSITTDRSGERNDGQREIHMSGTISQVAFGMNMIMNKLMDPDQHQKR